MTVPHANISAALVDLIRRTSVVADRLPEKPASSLAELLIAPRFYPAPFPELAAATVERGVMHVDRVDPMKALGENRVVVLIGDRESGVTAGLAWLLERRHLADPSLPALYIRFDTRQGKRVIEDDIHAAAAKVGWRVDRGTKVPPALIGIDDVERGSDRAIERLVAHIVDHPEHRYVIGCHSDSKRDVLGALVEAGLSPTALYLGPLNRPSEVQQLVRKIVRTPSKALADKVSAVLSAGRLPRTPFLMAALTVVLNAGDLQALDPTAVIDRYIDLMLGRTDIIYHGKFDYRRLIHALEYL